MVENDGAEDFLHFFNLEVLFFAKKRILRFSYQSKNASKLCLALMLLEF